MKKRSIYRLDNALSYFRIFFTVDIDRKIKKTRGDLETLIKTMKFIFMTPSSINKTRNFDTMIQLIWKALFMYPCFALSTRASSAVDIPAGMLYRSFFLFFGRLIAVENNAEYVTRLRKRDLKEDT